MAHLGVDELLPVSKQHDRVPLSRTARFEPVPEQGVMQPPTSQRTLAIVTVIVPGYWVHISS